MNIMIVTNCYSFVIRFLFLFFRTTVKPKEVKIITPVDKLKAGNALEVVCQTSGFRPSARIFWILTRRLDLLQSVNLSVALQSLGLPVAISSDTVTKWLPDGARHLEEVGSSVSENGRILTSFLSFRPKIDDHQRFLICLSVNPLFVDQNHFVHDHIRLDIECTFAFLLLVCLFFIVFRFLTVNWNRVFCFCPFPNVVVAS